MLESTLNPEFSREDFVLRDYLAADRTILANERTFLAYVRTAFTIFVAAATFIKFLDLYILQLAGWLFLPIGISLIFFGAYRYRQIKKLIMQVEKNKSPLPSLESEI